MPALYSPATFQNIQESHEVRVCIGVRVDQRVTDARLGRKMHNIRKAVS